MPTDEPSPARLLLAGCLRYEDIEWEGLRSFTKEKFDDLQAFDRDAWRKEVMAHEELFLELHDHLPPEMIYERELLICRL